jgi:hypothetical protein
LAGQRTRVAALPAGEAAGKWYNYTQLSNQALQIRRERSEQGLRGSVVSEELDDVVAFQGFQRLEHFLCTVVECLQLGSIATEMAKRHVGHAVAVELGVQFSQRDQAPEPELWFQGIGRARNKTEADKVALAINEWADGDSIASHYGFGIETFCSDDFGKHAAGPSVFDSEHRKWLADEFGVQFVTLAELATKVTT